MVLGWPLPQSGLALATTPVWSWTDHNPSVVLGSPLPQDGPWLATTPVWSWATLPAMFHLVRPVVESGMLGWRQYGQCAVICILVDIPTVIQRYSMVWLGLQYGCQGEYGISIWQPTTRQTAGQHSFSWSINYQLALIN